MQNTEGIDDRDILGADGRNHRYLSSTSAAPRTRFPCDKSTPQKAVLKQECDNTSPSPAQYVFTKPTPDNNVPKQTKCRTRKSNRAKDRQSQGDTARDQPGELFTAFESAQAFRSIIETSVVDIAEEMDAEKAKAETKARGRPEGEEDYVDISDAIPKRRGGRKTQDGG